MHDNFSFAVVVIVVFLKPWYCWWLWPWIFYLPPSESSEGYTTYLWSAENQVQILVYAMKHSTPYDITQVNFPFLNKILLFFILCCISTLLLLLHSHAPTLQWTIITSPVFSFITQLILWISLFSWVPAKHSTLAYVFALQSHPAQSWIFLDVLASYCKRINTHDHFFERDNNVLEDCILLSLCVLGLFCWGLLWGFILCYLSLKSLMGVASHARKLRSPVIVSSSVLQFEFGTLGKMLWDKNVLYSTPVLRVWELVSW